MKPPFPNLPTFNVSAIILSYFNDESIVRALMNLLSRNARAYFEKHGGILKSFLVEFKITGVLTIGDKEEEIDCGYPDPSLQHI